MSTLLTIDGVCQRFGASTALDHISLAVQQGEFIALLGPSGCGKTTLLRTIAGFLTPTTGRILIEDQDISRLPPHRRPLNTVFQNYALFPHMTVLDNVTYGPRRKGVARAEAREQANEALEMVGLTAFGLRYPRELSGGQQQRVALARAIVNRPKLLLLDEPLSALDLKLRKRVQLELKHLQQKLGIAFLFVTHDQEEAMTMADRIVVMHDGRVEQVGTGADIYRRPATRFVAEFIGQANILPYRRDDVSQVTYAAGSLVLPSALITSGADDGANAASTVIANAIPITTGNATTTRSVPSAAETGIAVLRPEDVSIELPQSHAPGSQSAQPDTVQISAVITDLVSVGSHTTVHTQVDGQPILACLSGLPPEHLASGQTVDLRWDANALHLIAGSA